MTDEQRRIAGYLKAQGARQTPEEVAAASRTPRGARRTSGWRCSDASAAGARRRPQARLDVTLEHPFFGPLTWRETLLFSRLHDLDHAGQLGKIAAAFGVPPRP